MNKPTGKPPQAHMRGKVVPLGTSIGSPTSIVTFATSSGIPVEEVVEFVNTGILPSVVVDGERMVDVRTLRHDLLHGKTEFVEGGYSHV